MSPSLNILNSLNDILWNYIVITMLAGSALYYTIRTRGLQFRLIGDMLKVLVNANISGNENENDNENENENYNENYNENENCPVRSSSAASLHNEN